MEGELGVFFVMDNTLVVIDLERAKKKQNLDTDFGKMYKRGKLTRNVAKSNLMRCCRDGVLGGDEMVVNGVTVQQVVKIRYSGVDIAAAGSWRQN